MRHVLVKCAALPGEIAGPMRTLVRARPGTRPRERYSLMATRSAPSWLTLTGSVPIFPMALWSFEAT